MGFGRNQIEAGLWVSVAGGLGFLDLLFVGPDPGTRAVDLWSTAPLQPDEGFGAEEDFGAAAGMEGRG